jgi:hypothetical protein
MTNQLNKGCILGFYADEKYQARNTNPDGCLLMASDKYLLPFMVWHDAAPFTVGKFRLVSVDTGEQVDLSTSLIARKKKSDNSRTWYYFDGSDVGAEFFCGLYYIVLELASGPKFVSDVIQVRKLEYGNHFTPLFDTLTPTPVVKIIHSGSAIESAVASYQNNGSGGSISTAVTISGLANSTTFTIPAGSLVNTWVKIRYWFKTFEGPAREVFLSVRYGPGPSFTPDIEVMGYEFTEAKSFFQLRLGASQDLGNLIYSTGWKQWIYLQGGYNYPQIQNEREVSINGDGETLLLSDSIRVKQELGLIEIPDQALPSLARVAILNNCDLYDLKTSQQFNLKELEFEVGQQEGYTSTGILRFQSEYAQTGACLENVGVVNV